MDNNTAENKNDRHERNKSIIRATNENYRLSRNIMTMTPIYKADNFRVYLSYFWCPGVSRNKLTDAGPLRTRHAKRFNLTGCLSITIAHRPRRKFVNYKREPPWSLGPLSLHSAIYSADNCFAPRVTISDES